MIVCAGLGIEMCVNASICRDKSFTMGLVTSIAVVCILRSLHILLIFCLFLMLPFFMCSDSCCLKRALVKTKAAPKGVTNLLQQNWTWTQGMQKVAYQNCLLCLSKFEAGQEVTFVPC
mmetsp:Transcript_39461/g.51652  ORF Transcript_39461/g.51652 Transcript_39461/m.51652 type:complete len:118 (+) Transcript_39461:502-855(+)